MAIELIHVSVANDTFEDWVGVTNTIVSALASVVVTTNGHPSGSLTSGNAQVNGQFQVNVAVAGLLHGGVLGTPATINLGSNLNLVGHRLHGNGDAIVSVGGTSIINATHIVTPNIHITFGNSDNFISNTVGANSISANNLVTNTFTTANLTANSISANNFEGNVITCNVLEANSLSFDEIEEVAANSVLANSISTNNIIANTQTLANLAANNIVANNITANTQSLANLAANNIVANNITTNSVSAAQSVNFTGDLTPTTITSDQNNYAPTGHANAFRFRLSTNASRTITGLAGGVAGRMIVIFNAGAQNIVLTNESSSSVEANRFRLVDSTLTLLPEESAIFQYDSTLSRWQRLLPSSSSSGGGTPIGTVLSYAGSSAPSKWLLCGGQAISRTTYADLFGIIGTTYGSGDGSTTFNVPDLRGRVVAGKDNMISDAGRLTNSGTGNPGINGDVLGASGGSDRHELTTAQLSSHSHSGPSHTHSIGNHTHSIPSHTHSIGSHTHSIGDHTHTIPNHSHGVGSHDHGVNPSTTVTTPGVNQPPTAFGLFLRDGVGPQTLDILNASGSTNHDGGGGSTSGASGTTGSGGSGTTGSGGSGTTGSDGATTTSSGGTGSTSSAGSDDAHPNQPPTLVLNYIIFTNVT